MSGTRRWIKVVAGAGLALAMAGVSPSGRGLGLRSACANEASGPPLDEPPIRRADKSFALALWLYAEGDLPGALAEFQRAYRAFPNFKVLYNIAAIERELHDWAGAMGSYRKYLAGGRDLIPAERRAQVDRALDELGQKIGRIQIESEGGAFNLRVDDRAYPLATPDQAVEVNPGHHRIRVDNPRMPPQIRTVDIASGDRVRLLFTAVPVPVTPRPAPPVVAAPVVAPGRRPDPRNSR